uniref:Uncharacterized protein n=1 Tax=Vespula pensylvanica TaxID=30213 RepID=A0A834UH52_VESPE|nr:hypothetical protein H0235_001325 [Vespula pensylvanica]
MGLGTIFVLYVSFMLIYSDQADVIEERVEATVLAKPMEKAGLLPMSLTARKINERSECVTKIIPIPYTAYVHRVFMYMLEVKIKGKLTEEAFMNDRKEEYRAIVFKVRTVGGRDSVEFETTCRGATSEASRETWRPITKNAFTNGYRHEPI